MSFVNNVTNIVITIDGDEYVLNLPTTKANAVASLASAKFGNIGEILINANNDDESHETYLTYRAWHTLCTEAVKDIDFAPLNEAAKAQIEAERLKAEKLAEEERAYYDEHIAPVERFNAAKAAKLNAIAEYDKSNAVNGFSINGMDGWLDRDTRTSLMNTVNIEKAAGLEETTLWFGNNSLTLNCDLVLGMLAQLEMYAHKCYNVTAQHVSNVQAMTTIEEIEAYNHTTGYPSKLEF